MSYLQFGRRKAKRKSQRHRTFESLEPRSMLAAQSAVFDFEELPATSLPRNGAHTELVQIDGQMRMTITRPGSRFDIVDNSGDQEKPFPFRERSIDPVADHSAKGEWDKAAEYQGKVSTILRLLRKNPVLAMFTWVLNARGIPGSFAPKPFRPLTNDQIASLKKEAIIQELLAE